MKTSLIIPITLSTLLASCGDGGSSSEVQPENDPVTPVTPVTSPGTPTDTDPELGLLSELIGNVGITYSFRGTLPRFTLALEFSEDNFTKDEDDDYGSLTATASSFVSQSPSDDAISGQDMLLFCSFGSSSDVFLCLSMSRFGITLESIFLFERLNNGFSQGVFEFCDDVLISDEALNTCAEDLLSSSDGDAQFIVANADSAIADNKVEPEKTDLLPYLQYLKQGSLENTVSADVLSHANGSTAESLSRLRRAINNQ